MITRLLSSQTISAPFKCEHKLWVTCTLQIHLTVDNLRNKFELRTALNLRLFPFILWNLERACPFFCKKHLRLSFLKYCSKWEIKVANWWYGCGLQIKNAFRTIDDLGEQEKFNLWTFLQCSLIYTVAAVMQPLLQCTLICGNSLANGFRDCMACSTTCNECVRM